MDKIEYKYFFGIRFPSDFPFTDKQCCQLALYLFANPYTSFYEARNIINNFKVFPSKQYVLNSLEHECSIFLTKGNNNEETLLKAFNSKFEVWFSVYSFPTIAEINEVVDIYQIPKKHFLSFILEMLTCNSFGIDLMTDYLSNFDSILNENEINEILDLYILKKNQNQLTTNPKNGIQLQLFNSFP